MVITPVFTGISCIYELEGYRDGLATSLARLFLVFTTRWQYFSDSFSVLFVRATHDHSDRRDDAGVKLEEPFTWKPPMKIFQNVWSSWAKELSPCILVTLSTLNK